MVVATRSTVTDNLGALRAERTLLEAGHVLAHHAGFGGGPGRSKIRSQHPHAAGGAEEEGEGGELHSEASRQVAVEGIEDGGNEGIRYWMGMVIGYIQQHERGGRRV